MSFRAKSSRTWLTSLVVAGVVLSLGLATNAFGATRAYSLSGNARTQIGNGLPLPITTVAPPAGKITFGTAGTVLQTQGSDPKKVMIAQSGLGWGPVTSTIALFQANSLVFQLKTSLVINGPTAPVSFSAGGRSGDPTFTWCPGQPLPTVSVNPACSASSPPVGVTVNASIRYEATGAQFGGVTQSFVTGGASLALKGGIGAPCDGNVQASCVALFSQAPVAPKGVVGGPIGNAFTSLSAGSGPLHKVVVNTAGSILDVLTQLGSLPNQTVKTVGAPFTTGNVTVSAPSPNELFFLKGGDNRVSGVGSLSMVAGGVSARSKSKDNANRGWLNYVIGPKLPLDVPSVSNTGLVVMALMFAGVTGWMVRRAVAPAS